MSLLSAKPQGFTTSILFHIATGASHQAKTSSGCARNLRQSGHGRTKVVQGWQE